LYILPGDTNGNWQQTKITETHNMSKLKVIMLMANEAVEEILNQTDLNIT
jgi:hypothetical protein